MKLIRMYFNNIDTILKILFIVFVVITGIVSILFLWHMYYFDNDFLQIIRYEELSMLLSLFLNKIYRIVLNNWLISLLVKIIINGFYKGREIAKKKEE